MGPYEDCSLGDSLSESSEELLQIGRREVSIYMIFVKGVYAVKHTFWQKVAARLEEQMSPLMILVLF